MDGRELLHRGRAKLETSVSSLAVAQGGVVPIAPGNTPPNGALARKVGKPQRLHTHVNPAYRIWGKRPGGVRAATVYTCVSALAYTGALPASLVADQVADTIAFREQAAISLDIKGTISGLDVDEDTWLAWRTEPPLVMMRRNGDVWATISHDVMEAPASATARRGAIDVLDAGSSSVLRFDESSFELLEQIPVGSRGSIESAAPVAEGWLVAVRDDLGNTSVAVAALADGKYEVSEVIDVPFASHVRPTEEDGILITAVLPPFSVLRVRSTGEVEEFQSVADRFPIDQYDMSLPAVPLDRGYLQMLSDTRSDQRAMILYSTTGDIIRTTTLEVAIGFVSSDPSSQLLFGARQLGVQELVSYSWSWAKRDSRPN